MVNLHTGVLGEASDAPHEIADGVPVDGGFALDVEPPDERWFRAIDAETEGFLALPFAYIDDDENGVYLCQSLAKEKEAAHRERKTGGSHKHPCKVRIGQFSPRGEDGGSLGRRRRRFVSRETETGAERRNRRGHARGFESAKDDDDGTTDGRRW